MRETWEVSDTKSLVVPCCMTPPDPAELAKDRIAARARLGLEDKSVIAYCGSAAPCQCLDESLTLFKKVRELPASSACGKR